LENSNLLIGTLEGATGVKTGWTSRAGYSLVASAERRGIELFAVVLGTQDEMERFQQAGLLLEWGFVHYVEQRLAESGEVLGTLPVSDYLDKEIEAVVGVPAALPVFDLAGEVTRDRHVARECRCADSAWRPIGHTLTSAG
jgi:D-alanyl-D-alanine carboxypeptidase